MAFITKVLGKILGNKSERDIKEISPQIEKIKEEYARISALHIDGLREESDKLKKIISDRIKPEEDEIRKLKIEVEEVEIQESEKIYEKIDKLEEVIVEKLEEVLNEVLPTAFAWRMTFWGVVFRQSRELEANQTCSTTTPTIPAAIIAF